MDEIGDPQVETHTLDFGGAFSADDQNRQLSHPMALFHLVQNGEAVHLWHIQIQKEGRHGIEGSFQQKEGFRPVCRCLHHVVLIKDISKKFPVDLRIIHYQDPLQSLSLLG